VKARRLAGISLPLSVFDEDQCVTHAAITQLTHQRAMSERNCGRAGERRAERWKRTTSAGSQTSKNAKRAGDLQLRINAARML
jgi:hypothetical protein